MAADAAEFWKTFETETGEKVLARSMGELYRSEDRGSGVWGLLILTDKSFRFKHMPNDNWLLSLFRRADRSSGPEKIDDIVIPHEDILAVKAPKRDFLERLFGPAFKQFSILSRREEGEISHRFSVDPGSGLLPALLEIASLASRPE
jgi:hypothetical protein